MDNINLTTFYLFNIRLVQTCQLFNYSRLSRGCCSARGGMLVHASFTLVARARVSSACYIVRVRASFACCRVVSRVINSPRLKSLVLIKLFN
jgi:hypothetical protein